MDIKRMITFQKVALLKNFSKASMELFMSQPTITLHISELEKELNVKLLSRNKKYVELTEAGERFLTYVNQIIELHNEARKSIDSLKSGMEGLLNIAVSGSVFYWLISKLYIYKDMYPKVDLNLFSYSSPEIVEMVVNRKVHFGLIRHTSPTYYHPFLIAKDVESDESILVTPPNHRFLKMQQVTLYDVSKERLLVFGKNQDIRKQVLDAFPPPLSPRTMEINEYQAMKLLVKASIGVTFLPEICVQEEIGNGSLLTFPVVDCKPIIRYSILLYRKDLIINDYINAFISLIKT